ncbi:MAG: CHAT domain-containing protein, partial [Coleofasciculaceae cyanobacterium]
IGDEAGVTRGLINQSQAMEILGLHPRACKTILQVFEFSNQDCRNLGQAEQEKLLSNLRQQATDSPLKLAGLNNLGSLLRTTGNLEVSQEVLRLSLELQEPSALGSTYLSLANTEQDISQRQREAYRRSQKLQDLQKARQATQTALDSYQKAAQEPFATQLQGQLNRLSLLLKVEQWLQVAKEKAKEKAETGSYLAPPGRSPAEISLKKINNWLPEIQSQIAALDWTQLQRDLIELPPSYNGVLAQTQLAENLFSIREISAKTSLDFGSPSWENIEKLLTVALQNAETIDNYRAQALSLGYYGHLYEHKKNWSKAETLTKKALHFSQSTQSWDIAYRWSWQLGRIYQEKGETQKEISAYKSTFQILQRLRQDLAGSDKDFQFTFREKVEEPVYRKFVDLLLSLDNPSQANLKQARQVIESLQIAELENFLQEPCAEPNLEKIDSLIDKQDQTAAFIYPIILDDHISVILKLPGDKKLYLHHSEDVSATEVRTTLADLRIKLQEVIPDKAKTQSEKVYNWLIKPIKNSLDENNIKTLVFVLDGSMRNVPMAALYNGEKYLIEDYAIVVAPNLVLKHNKPLVKEDLKVLGASLTEPPKGFEQFSTLDNVDTELNEIGKTGVDLTSLRDQKFTRSNFNEQLNESAFQIVHIATHGKFSSDPEDTFILTADGKLKVEELDKLFQQRNLTQADAIQMLVFSACETASGDERADLGIAGSSVKAGANSVVATLWSVDDKSSVEFMKHLYQSLGQPNVSKAEALRLAQVHLLESGEYKASRYWAPYILVGNWL